MDQAGRPLMGVALVSLAVFLFALSDVVGKHLMTLYPVPFVQAGRYLVNLSLLLVIMAPRHGAGLWQTRRTGLVLLRGGILAMASLTMGHALRLMPVGEAVTISYLAPFLLMLASGPVLGERVPGAAWVGAGVAFCGVLLILRPGSGLDPVGVIWALANAGLATGYMLTTRMLTRSETTMAMLFHVALVGSVIFVGMALADWPAVLPGAGDAGLILLLGCLATGGHFLFTAAFREAPAALLAPINYVHLVWAGLLGWLVFDHLPDALSIAGMALVLAAGMSVALRAARQS
ncbi:DMT family transporter [Neogemmobacter tilapiae]|uniref:Membrane protein n=1 Tax=Neogemmobacter tilapiae TaxID=875041 RepID=A0A918WP73_9RHOB|nr:DMT family transporter [Gemmobacter tilapiae]GHC63216.1 membrane protein [Gemmobacter tilapiae]